MGQAQGDRLVPDKAMWSDKAVRLREAAGRQADTVAQQTLLRLAEDCEAIAAEMEGQQPGKPKPPGNPQEKPDTERRRPIGDPPRPVQTPPAEPPPAPLQARK
jgi:hypothetical protein